MQYTPHSLSGDCLFIIRYEQEDLLASVGYTNTKAAYVAFVLFSAKV